jgi:TM2 domain-containing membrane protein YozV
MEDKQQYAKPPKSPALAGILSFFFPGAGSFYNGQPGKFLIIIVATAVIITMLAQGVGSPVFLGLMLGALYFYQLIDAVMTASLINKKALRGETEEIVVEELPEFVKTGSVFWGVVLMILGVVLLMANFEFLISYDRIWNLWPLVVIIVGIKLIADYYAKSREAE